MNENAETSRYSRPQDTNNLAREKRLFAYHCALENGDFEVVADVLAERSRTRSWSD